MKKNVTQKAQIDESRMSGLLEGARDWRGNALDLVKRVDLAAGEIAMDIDLAQFLSGGAVVRHVVPARIRRRGVERRLVLWGDKGGPADAQVDPALVKAIVRGRTWLEQLATGRVRSIAEIAEAEGVSSRYVGQLIPLAFLAPDIVAKILSGTQPVDLTTQDLTKRIDLPLAWAAQRTLLGFE